MSLLLAAVDVLANVPTLIPDPDPVAPPGAEAPVGLLLGWGKWIGLIAAVIGIIIIGVKITINIRRGEAAGELGGLLYVAIACILFGSAASIVGFLSGY